MAASKFFTPQSMHNRNNAADEFHRPGSENMDEETEKELTEHACELWAIRTVATELLADRLERSNDLISPRRVAQVEC
jgi:hypothetical protein